MTDRVDLLFFGAHPDDIELSAGGTIAKAVRDGLAVGVVDLTRGEMGTRGTPETRREEAQNAARAIGASFREQLDLGDGGLRTGRDEEMKIIECIRRWKPSIIFAAYPDDRHPDHARGGRLVTDAWFYAGLRQLECAGLPAHRPQAVIYFMQHFVFEPTFIVDVTAVWETKMRGIDAYASQFFNPASAEPRTKLSDKSFIEMIEARARHYGAMIGATFGEPFFTKQPPRLDDLIGAYRGREV
jgi:bacillithiol biosynthesis deacetylase BshB1